MRFGVDTAIAEQLQTLSGRSLAVVANQASLTSDGVFSPLALDAQYPRKVCCILTPQHGLWGEQQANMIETGHGVFGPLGVPLHSLYSETRRPTASMLADVDTIVVDLQDVGTRVYTFVWTLLECMKAAADFGKTLVVLDRPNPIGGTEYEGPILDAAYRSFVGGASIPMRHGLTLGEASRLLKNEFEMDLELEVVGMLGWTRTANSCWPQEVRWHWPSPNMPTLETTSVYPGQVLLEGTSLSEGRGTTRPFELLGAPEVDAELWYRELRQCDFPGIRLMPTQFIPTFDKWSGQSCAGIDIGVVERNRVESLSLTCYLLASLASKQPDKLQWLPPPYEYEYEKMPIDILWGNDNFRMTIDSCRGKVDWRDRVQPLLRQPYQWQEKVDSVRLY